MASQPKEAQTRAYSETKLFEIHGRVFLLAVPPEIILPKDWSIIFATTLDSTNPVDLAMFMYGFDMTL
jgi:hypothetical protein